MLNSRKLVNTTSPFPIFHGIPEGLNTETENEAIRNISQEVLEALPKKEPQNEARITIEHENIPKEVALQPTSSEKQGESSPKEEIVRLDLPKEEVIEIEEPRLLNVEDLPKNEENAFKVKRFSTPFPKGLEEEKEETPLKIVPTKKRNYFKSFLTECPHCKRTVRTQCDRVLGTLPWIGCMSLIGIGIIFGILLLPFISLSFYEVVHTCPDCHKEITRFPAVKF